MTEASDGSGSGALSVSNQLATVVPTFDPIKDDLQVYQQKVALLLEAWPAGKYTELATRLILNSTGSAFKKLQLHQSELIANDRKSAHRIVELLGRHWGRIFSPSNVTNLPSVLSIDAYRKVMKVQTPIWLGRTSCGLS